ncbi:TadE-like protein [Actinomadura rubteroloni]|uniref:TadE-like protein n=1 Tax=Actinomadura rubteroloni TaxID=1926885 RepID=A0A2P4UPR1_9ACTN|nr:TadE/TadG family type IV pilus assembly protein [Actinomadura rubteroloni]POM27041.1 TadE-like protein [Actinomadura rubteroloni]
MRARENGDRGSVAVEFGLLIPILLIVILGTFDLGRMVFQKMELSEAAGQAARAAALAVGAGRSPQDAAQAAVQAVSPTGLRFTLTNKCTSAEAIMKVTVTCAFKGNPAWSGIADRDLSASAATPCVPEPS